MSGAVVVLDPDELDQAVSALRGIRDAMSGAARGLAAVDATVEMPAGLAGRVISEISAVSSALVRAAASLEAIPEDLSRRAHLARLADRLAVGQHGKLLLTIPADIVGAFRKHEVDAATRGAPRPGAQAVGADAGRWAKNIGKGGRGLGHFGSLLELGTRTWSDLANPNLDTKRRVVNAATRVAALGAAEAGSVVAGRLAAAAVGGAMGGPAGVAASVTLSLGWYVFDSKLHATDWLAYRAVDAVDAAAAAGDAVGDAAGDAADAVGDGVDKAKDLIGGIL